MDLVDGEVRGSLVAGDGARGLFLSLIEGGQAGVRGVIREALVERCLLWDEEALALRVLAVLAHRQLSEGRSRRSSQFVGRVVEEAIQGLLFDAAPCSEVRSREAGGFEVFGLPVGVSGAAAARACRAHNRMDLLERRAFRGLVIEGRSLDDVAAQLGVDGGRVARGARAVLMKFFEETVTPGEGSNDFGVDHRSVRLDTGVPR